jgi:hypothetical protein
MLWLYNVSAKLIALLEDLHTGTTATVRLDGSLGPAFEVTAGIRQGCVAAPMLFNVSHGSCDQEGAEPHA